MKKKIKVILIITAAVIVFTAAVYGYFYKTNLRVKGAEVSVPQKIYHALTIPNDTNYSVQWNFPKVKAPEAWSKTTGSADTIIAVLDTGVLLNHQDLIGKTVPGYDFIGKCPNGYDYKEDNSVCQKSQIVYGTDASPALGGGEAVYHGTLVAGLVASNTNNSKLMAGSCWNCKIMPVRVLNNEGVGASNYIAQGITFAADNGAKIINMSLGYAHSYGEDAYLTSAIDYAYSKGVVLVAAAGNDGKEVNYPAAYEKVIAVGSVDSNDVRSSWSSFGPELDVVAPGVNVPSLYTYWENNSYITNSMAYASGTSISAPQVAGLAGLLVSQFPAVTSTDIVNKIKNWSDNVSGMSGIEKTDYYGEGRINSLNSLSSALKVDYPKNNSIICDKTPTISGLGDTGSTISIYIDDVLSEQVAIDNLGKWSYTSSELPIGLHSLRVESGEIAVNVSFTIKTKSSVYRFWSDLKQKHFYTISKAEKDQVIAKYPTIWKYEGVSFDAYPGSSSELKPVYRFWSDTKQSHFYTISESEKNSVISRYPTNIWKYEGIAYYASSSQVQNTKPLYRFWSDTKQAHFYTASESEKNYVISRYPIKVWKYEGIGYYIPL